MDIVISYSKSQLESAVNYIAEKNVYFRNKHNQIRQEILDSMKTLAADPEMFSIGTMGFLLTCDFRHEGVDSDNNICEVDIHVNPSLGIDYNSLDDSDRAETLINSKKF